MRSGILFILIILLGACSQVPQRKLASFESDFFSSSIDPSASQIKIFPPKVEEGVFRYYLYLVLKDHSHRSMDIYAEEVSLMSSQKNDYQLSLKRLSQGKYYLELAVSAEEGVDELTLFIQNNMVKEFKLSFQKASFAHSSLQIIRKERNGLRMRLFLSDSLGKGLLTVVEPDLIIEGEAIAENLEQVGVGIWEFDLDLTDQNQIIYVSVRSQGAYLKHLFRYLHIEK